uniref:SIS domain-containing protein n=1 Tax=Periophthalmus magnuspinnatus TaxID=409849 RepID=A0A3B4B7D8_9GOBI
MEVALRVETIIKDPENSLVVLSGCGTSGRLAFLIATTFNKALKELNKQPVYTYTIAGGDRQVLIMKCMYTYVHIYVCEGKKHVLYIGISCGLSAPFVAGQLDFCLQHLQVYTPVLIGFNPANQARSDPIQGSTFTFYDIVQRMQAAAIHQKAFLINPAVGPEAVSGSSRMKGGSATKILLEVITQAAHGAAFAQRPITLHGRCVCYLGWGRLGVLGLIDASECVPTFGGSDFYISHEDFLSTVLPSLNDKDTVILIYTEFDDQSEVSKMAARVKEQNCKLHTIVHRTEEGAAVEKQWELSTKLMLNSISTGAHVLKGKIYQNYMIDVQVTNSKLYQRATRLLQKFSGRSEIQCQEALLKAVYAKEELNDSIALKDVCAHAKRVVPLALVCLLTGCSLVEAESNLENQPIIRDAVTAGNTGRKKNILSEPECNNNNVLNHYLK